VNGKLKTLDFGAPDEYGAQVFRVEIPTARRAPVRIIEDYSLKGGEGGLPYEELRAVVDRPLWSEIAEAARRDFNERLKVKKLPTSRWKLASTRWIACWARNCVCWRGRLNGRPWRNVRFYAANGRRCGPRNAGGCSP
jgi:hypothetical protein